MEKEFQQLINKLKDEQILEKLSSSRNLSEALQIYHDILQRQKSDIQYFLLMLEAKQKIEDYHGMNTYLIPQDDILLIYLLFNMIEQDESDLYLDEWMPRGSLEKITGKYAYIAKNLLQYLNNRPFGNPPIHLMREEQFIQFYLPQSN